MLSQLASQISDFSSQYGSDNTISYTAGNISGKPTVYPNYGDSTQTFAFRTYGPWWELGFYSSRAESFNAQDFIEIKLEKEVCPFEIKIYETYNPGAVTRILGFNAKSCKWIILWSGPPELLAHESRIFSPQLFSNHFLTNTLRIEFSHFHSDYYCEIDAIEVAGSIVEFQNHCLESTKNSSKVSNQTIGGKKTNITSLPSEVFNLILSYLNLETLCRACQVSTFFKKHCYDSVLYQHLNLQPLWHKINNNSLRGLESRCQFLQELNLAWCGSQTCISSSVFKTFILSCGRHLTILDLSNCPFVDNECLLAVTRTSSLLQSLSLKNNLHNSCLTSVLQEIANLKNLQCLNLYRTGVCSEAVIKIIRYCKNLEKLCLGGCYNINNYDEVAFEIGSNLTKLKQLDMWRAQTLSALGIQHIGNGCSHLEDLDIGWCNFIDAGTGCIQQLAVKCPKLKRLVLCSIRTLSDTDVLSISFCCPDLEQIDILGTRDVTPPTLEQFLYMSKNLRLMDVSFSAQISPSHVAAWKSSFPSVCIKQSFKPSL